MTICWLALGSQLVSGKSDQQYVMQKFFFLLLSIFVCKSNWCVPVLKRYSHAWYFEEEWTDEVPLLFYRETVFFLAIIRHLQLYGSWILTYLQLNESNCSNWFINVSLLVRIIRQLTYLYGCIRGVSPLDACSFCKY